MARILIADDDPHASEMIARICQFKGHDVEEVRDAVQALESFDRNAPDLVITDLAMPLGGGQRLVQEMRQRAEMAGCPVMLNSCVFGYTDSCLREASRACCSSTSFSPTFGSP